MDLGSIQALPLKALWPGEATEFTPWLSKNLELLGNKLGMDLELESVEAAAGDFAADIVARDLSTNRRVVIENQFGSTDHRHLGQILTYSSVLGAGAVVWIAEVIRAEHKAAIEFLNQNLKDGLQLYAVQASVIRIDNSKPAFVLNVVSLPSEAPVAAGATTSQPSETRERYRSFFQSLIDELREKHHFTNAKVGQPQNWYTFASESSRLYKYGANFAQGGKVRVEIYIDCEDKAKNEQLFDCLLLRREQIEAAVEGQLSWERLDARRACRVALYRDGNIDTDTETLEDIRLWAIRNLLRFRAIFPTHITQCWQGMVNQVPSQVVPGG